MLDGFKEDVEKYNIDLKNHYEYLRCPDSGLTFLFHSMKSYNFIFLEYLVFDKKIPYNKPINIFPGMTILDWLEQKHAQFVREKNSLRGKVEKYQRFFKYVSKKNEKGVEKPKFFCDLAVEERCFCFKFGKPCSCEPKGSKCSKSKE